MKKFIKIIIITISVTLGMNAAVAAASAHNNLTLRSGPGSRYPITGTIKSGTAIKFDLCNPMWCHIHTDKVQGWIRTKTIITKPETFAYHYKKPRIKSFSNGTVKSGHSFIIRLRIIPYR